jgi:soluble lytic murein transglycosylase-like protein
MSMLLCKNRSRAINAKRKLLSAVLTIALSGAAVEVRAGGLPANEQERTELRLFLKTAIDKSDSFADRFDAEVWLLDMSTRLTPFMHDPEERLDLLRTIHREAKRAQLKPDLVLALIQVESKFDRYAVSRAGAQGLMQVMPFWKNEIGHPEDNLTDVSTNLRYGCQILKYYMQKESGSWMNALARYNGSYGKLWYPARVMDAWRDRWYAGDL